MTTLRDFHALTLEKQDIVERPHKNYCPKHKFTRDNASSKKTNKAYKRMRNQLREENYDD